MDCIYPGTRRAVEKWDKVDRLLQLAGVSVEKVLLYVQEVLTYFI